MCVGVPWYSQVCCCSSLMVEECRVEDKTSFNSSPAPTARNRNVQRAGRDTVPPGTLGWPGCPEPRTAAPPPVQHIPLCHAAMKGKASPSSTVVRMRVNGATDTVVIHSAMMNVQPVRIYCQDKIKCMLRVSRCG